MFVNNTVSLGSTVVVCKELTPWSSKSYPIPVVHIRLFVAADLKKRMADIFYQCHKSDYERLRFFQNTRKSHLLNSMALLLCQWYTFILGSLRNIKSRISLHQGYSSDSERRSMVCPPVRRDNPLVLASGFLIVQRDEPCSILLASWYSV